jgi:aryl-alcohol dehydrogenase-like predicted oxidoreductase
VDAQYAALVEAMKKYDFDFVQVDYSMQDRTAEKEVFPVAKDKGMGVLVNVPLGGRRGNNLMQQVVDDYYTDLRFFVGQPLAVSTSEQPHAGCGG